MLQYGQPFLATLINFTIIMLPASILSFVLLLHLKAVSLLPKQLQILCTKVLFWSKEWSMPEIFLVGVLVSLVKIISLAEISLGLSFWAYAGFVFCFVFTLVKLDRMAIWDKVAHHSEFSQNACNVRAVDEGLAACPQCQILTEKPDCPRCGTEVCVRDPYNLQKTLAWTITAALLYIPANLYPIMTTVFLSVPEPSTIIGGVALLWQHGSYPIALVIFIASVMVPLSKLTVLFVLVWVVKWRVRYDKLSFTMVYHVTEFLGKWSMIDVFVVAVLVALVHLGGIMEIMPGPGALYFSAMVIASMLAAHTFDPKQLWDIDQAVTDHE
jgi:paraquat-inducible protein A